MRQVSIGAAALAAAFVILHDTVGSGPSFEKGQVVPAEELEFLGIERLLLAKAIAPHDPTPPPPPAPTETEQLQAAWAQVERYGRMSAEALQDAEQAKARAAALEADLAGVNRDRERLEAELVAARSECEAHLARIKELEAQPQPEPKPADKPAKKGS